MKQKINFATWWRYISGQKVVENAIFILWPLKWRHQVENFCFYHMQKNYLDIFNILGV